MAWKKIFKFSDALIPIIILIAALVSAIYTYLTEKSVKNLILPIFILILIIVLIFNLFYILVNVLFYSWIGLIVYGIYKLYQRFKK
jgi:uncharacterized membrane protein YadS